MKHKTLLILIIGLLFSISCVSAATVSHPASQVLPGSFQSGNYYFPSGNVGIGTTSPEYNLHVQGITSGYIMTDSSSDMDSGIVIGENGSNKFLIRNDASKDILDFYNYGHSGTSLAIDYTGNVGIGTTSPTHTLDVVGTARLKITSGEIGTDEGSYMYGLDRILWYNHESADYSCVDQGTGAGGLYYDRSDGLYLCRMGTKTRIADTNNGLTSDIRLKKNISELSGVLDKLNNIRSISFNWNDEYESLYNPNDKLQLGFVAQELLEEFPELIVNDGDYLEVQFRKVPVLSIAAIKELKAEKDAEIAQLKLEIYALKQLVCQDHPTADICQ